MRRAKPQQGIVRALARLAAPVALARLGIMGMGITDTVVVGQLAPDELSDLALGWAPTGVLLVTGIGLLLGVQVLAARMLGEGRPEAAGAVWRRGVALGAVTGALSALALWIVVEDMLLLFGIAPDLAAGAARVARIIAISMPLHFCYVASAFFVEAIHRPLPGTVAIWAANAVNLAINLALVPSLGAVGSAWATVGARAFMFAALAAWILASRDGRAHGVLAAAASAPSYRALLAVGGAAAVSQMAEAGAFSAMTVIAGRIGADAVAAYQIVLNAVAVVFMVSLGIAAATAVLTSRAYGARDLAAASHAGWTGMAVETAAMAVGALVFVAFREPLGAAFTSDPALAATVAAALPVAAVLLFPDGGQSVASSALRARGDNWFPTASHVFAYVAVMPPLAFVLGESFERGVAGLIEASVVASLISVAVLALRMRALDRG